MTNRTQNLVIWILIGILGLSCAMIYGESRKTNENLPILSEVFTMRDKDVKNKVTGYMEHQLLNVWGTPDRSSSDQLVWLRDEGLVSVLADSQGRIYGCSVKRILDVPVIYTAAFSEEEELKRNLIGRSAGQLATVWDKPHKRDGEDLIWIFQFRCPHKGITVTIDELGLVSNAVFLD